MLLFAALAASDVLAARPKVLVKVKIDVPAYAERWRKMGRLTTLESDLAAKAQPLFEEKFAFLDWLGSGTGTGGAQLLITLQEDPNSPRAPGLRPWVLLPSLIPHGLRAPAIRFYDADVVGVFLPRNDLERAAKNLADKVHLVLKGELRNEGWPKAFVAEVLSALPVATGIQAYGSGAALIEVPHANLRATKKSILHADFDGAPPNLPVRKVLLYLAPIAGRGGKTECSIENPPPGWPRGFQEPERPQYIDNPKSKTDVFIGMIFYERATGGIKSGETLVENK